MCGSVGVGMTLSPDLKHTIRSHTANMPGREKEIRVDHICKTYRITDSEDIREARRIAAIPEDESK